MPTDEESKMKYIGAHVSISGGAEKAPQNAKETGAKSLFSITVFWGGSDFYAVNPNNQSGIFRLSVV